MNLLLGGFGRAFLTLVYLENYNGLVKPTENGQIESFNGTMRNELLRGIEFESVREARAELEKWREKYNNEQPHSALNYEPPSSRRRPHGGRWE